MNTSVSRKVIIRSALVIVTLIGILAVSSLFYIYKLDRETEQSEKTLNQKVEVLFEMSQIIRDRSFDVFSMYLTDDIWRNDEIYIRFNKRALRFIQLREKLIAIGLNAAQSKEFNKALAIIKTTQPLQENFVENIREERRDKIKNELVSKDLPLEIQLYSTFDNLIQLAREESAVAQAKIEQQYNIAIVIIFILAVVIVLITVFLMWQTMRKIISNEMIIKRDAEHDHLTNTYNRRWLNNYLLLHESVVSKDIHHAVLYIDLDNFKPVNDEYGHEVGDCVLIDAVETFRNCIRRNDSVVRVGGDEFVILLESCDEAKATEIANEIIKSVSDYQLFFNQQVISGISCSIGIGLVTEDIPWKIALQQADEECNRVKRQGKSNISIYQVAG